MRNLPTSGIINVKTEIAEILYNASNEIAQYSNVELRSLATQNIIKEAIRSVNRSIFDDLIEQIIIKLRQRPYCVHIKGLKFDQYFSLYIALAAAIGNIIDPFMKPWSKVMHVIKPATDWKDSDLDRLTESLHTDATNRTYPNDFTCLLCLNKDQFNGGRSRILDKETILIEAKKEFGSKIVELLYNDFLPWLFENEGDDGIKWFPIYSSNSIRWMYHTIEKALKLYQIIPSNDMKKIIYAMQQITSKSESTIDFMLNPGELLIINNKQTLHARSSYPFPKLSNRLILRLKINSRN